MKLKLEFNINGILVPTIIYGTAWKENQTQLCVRNALTAGFRGIDTANQRKHYHEEGVGLALKEMYGDKIIARKDLFIQTKFTHIAGQDHRLPYDKNADTYTQVLQSFTSSLEHLHTDYIDSYILHGPSKRFGLGEQDWEAWCAMEELHQTGKAKLLGISNVSIDQLRELYEQCIVKPTFVQNRCYAKSNWDGEIREYCKNHNIWYQGFSLLTANQHITQHPRFIEIAKRNKCTSAQLIFYFAHCVNIIPLTGTTDPLHMKEDLNLEEIELNEDDVTFIEHIKSS